MKLGRLAVRFAGAIVSCGFLVLLAAGLPLKAQNLSTGSLNVTVHDSSGAAVNGARLNLRDLETNDVHTAVTAGAGTAVIPYLNPARYGLSVTKEGFATQAFDSVTVQTNQVTDLQVTLQVGAATQTITVAGNTHRS